MPLADALDIPLQRLKARYEASPLPAFLAWWVGQLRALLPPRWQAALRTERAWIEIEPVPGGVDLRLPGNAGQIREAVRADAADEVAESVERLAAESKDARRVLLLPPARVLRRVLPLPAAARERLQSVLGFELDRQTPFKPDQVHFDAKVRGEEAGGKQIRVELALVPRSRLDEALAALGPLAATLDAVDVRGVDGRRAGFNLLPPERRMRRANLWLWINAGLVAAGVLVLLLAMSQTLANREAALAQLGAEVEARRAEARAVNQFRRGLDEAVEGANFLAVRRAQQPIMADLLNELTRLLPDDTYLERLNFDGERVTVHGLSSQAAALLALLQSSQLLRDPSLSGPIQPDQRAGKDRFQITAGYGPQTEEKAGAADARR